MKRILAMVVCLCLLFCGCSDKNGGTANNADVKDIISFEGYKGDADDVMTINGEGVSVDEFNYFLIMASYDIMKANGAEEKDLNEFFAGTDVVSKKTFGELAIERAINDCTVFHVYRTEAVKQGIVLTDEDKEQIRKQADRMKDNYGEYMNTLQLKVGGLTPEVNTDITEMGYYSNKLFSKFVGEYDGITDEYVKEFYNDNFVRAKHILIMTVNPETGEALPEEEQKEALREANEVFGKVKAGENFDVLMAEHTDDTGYQTKPDGYTFAMDDEYTEAFKATAFELEVGEVSEQIVQSEYGYHIIKREPLLEDFTETSFEVIHDKIFRADFQKMLDKCNEEAEIIGNEPVFTSVNVARVLGDYLSIQEETLELIKEEFMRIDGNKAAE